MKRSARRAASVIRGRALIVGTALVLVAIGAAVLTTLALSPGSGRRLAPPNSGRTTPQVSVAHGGGHVRGVNCVLRPSRCSYPDPTNTGVPVGTVLTRSGPIEVQVPGTVVSGLDVHGTIRVMANDVTIKDSRVSADYPEGAAVFIAQNVSGTVIEDSTIRGQDSRGGSVAYAILNADWPPNASTVVRSVQMYNCAECYNGPGTVVDSFMDVSAVISGAHYEDVFYGGGTRLTLRHDTLLNPQPQTAVVYTEPDGGPVSDVTIADSLLAGGGWTIYGGGATTTAFKVTANRFAASYYPRIGHFGLDTAINPPQTTWTRNVWDATGKAIQG